MSNYSHCTVKSFDGTSLYVQHWKPTAASEEPKAQLLIVHGYLEHGSRYREVAEAMASQYGILTSVFDQRGHGKSSGQRGYVWSFRDYHADLECVVQNLDANNIPLFVLGHSNGGLITLDYLMQKYRDDGTIKGVLITCPFLAPAEELPRAKILASKVLGNLIPRLAIPATEVTSTDLTHDEAKQKEHESDTLNLHAFTVGWALEAMKAQDRVRSKCRDKIPVPLFFAYGDEDTVANAAVNKEFGEAITQPDKTFIERKGCRHEVLNETDRSELYEMIGKWILDHATK